MPRKGRFSSKQDRMAKHIMESEIKKGMPMKMAKSVGYATVVKQKKKKSMSKKK